VGDDNKAHIRQVTLTKQDETQSVIGKGLEPPERVVTTGFVRLTDGATVVIGSADGTPAPQPARSRQRGNRPAGSGGNGARSSQ